MKTLKADNFLHKAFERNSKKDIKIDKFYKIIDTTDKQKYLVSFLYKNIPLYTICVLEGLKDQHISSPSDISSWIEKFEGLCNGTEWLTPSYKFIAQSVFLSSQLISPSEVNTLYYNSYSTNDKLESRIARYIHELKSNPNKEYSFEKAYLYCIKNTSMILSCK